MKQILDQEMEISNFKLGIANLKKAKAMGFSDFYLLELLFLV